MNVHWTEHIQAMNTLRSCSSLQDVVVTALDQQQYDYLKAQWYFNFQHIFLLLLFMPLNMNFTLFCNFWKCWLSLGVRNNKEGSNGMALKIRVY